MRQPLFPLAHGVEGLQPPPLITLTCGLAGVFRQAGLLDLAHGTVGSLHLALACGGVGHAPAAGRGKERLAGRQDQHPAALAAERADHVEALTAKWLGLRYHLERLVDQLAKGAALDRDLAAVDVSDDRDGPYSAPAPELHPLPLSSRPQVALDCTALAQVRQRQAQAVIRIERGCPSSRSVAAYVRQPLIEKICRTCWCVDYYQNGGWK